MLLKIFPFFPHLIFPFFIFTFLTSPTLFISFFSQIWNKQALSLILIFLIKKFHGLPHTLSHGLLPSSFFLFCLSLFLIYFFYSIFFSFLFCFHFLFSFFHFPLKHLGLPFIYGSSLFFFCHFLFFLPFSPQR